jgi:peptidoglycan hydrolase-like protein with peptidoglycan-binding domain
MLRHLSLGARGQDVLALQQGLNLRRPPQDAALAEDGIFGPETDAALRRFQHRNCLPATGIAGPLTRAAIFPRAGGSAKVLTGGLSGEPRACIQR